jgi:outer membrane protein TolC
MRESLLVFLNIPVGTPVRIETGDSEQAASVPDTMTADQALEMVSAREDIRSAELRLESLKMARKIRRATNIPSLLAAYNLKFANDDYEDPDKLDPGWSLSIILDWPIIDWGKNRYELKKVDIQIAQMSLGIEAARLQASTEVLEAHRKLRESQELLEVAREGVENAQRALEIAELQYTEGALTHVELHEARKELTAAQAQQIQARTAKALAMAGYELAVGE